MITVETQRESLFSYYKYSSKNLHTSDQQCLFCIQALCIFNKNVATYIFMLSKYEQKFNKNALIHYLHTNHNTMHINNFTRMIIRVIILHFLFSVFLIKDKTDRFSVEHTIFHYTNSPKY